MICPAYLLFTLRRYGVITGELTSPDRLLRVEALDAAGKIVARGRPIRADGLDIPVEWESGARPEGGAPLRLRFSLRNARIFALWSPEPGR